MAKQKALHNFYKSKAWRIARTIKTNATLGKCERCGALGEEVHHKIRLTTDNLNQSMISLDQSNLEHLCKDCHNKEHGRFKKTKVIFDSFGNYIG